jgi:hypothetical protein
VKTHAAPKSELSCGPPTNAVFPSAESATDVPCPAFPLALIPTSLFPCWLQTPFVRVNTHAAPAAALLERPPTSAVFPSAERATEEPCRTGGPK